MFYINPTHLDLYHYILQLTLANYLNAIMVLHAPVIMIEQNVNAPKTQQGVIVMKVNLFDNYNRVYI